jgi:flagellar biosynthetic protein FliQ
MDYDESAVYLVRETLFAALRIAGPVLLAGVVIGLVVSLVQSITSIQDQTLTFVPKIVTMLIVAALLLPWIALRLAEYAEQLFSFM